jgi:hypothetical protein
MEALPHKTAPHIPDETTTKILKSGSILHFLFLAYFVSVMFLPFFRKGGLLTDFLVAPLYFLVPAGFALLLFSTGNGSVFLRKAIGRSSTFILGYVVGCVIVTLIFFLREKYRLTAVGISGVYIALHAGALLGFLRSRDIFRPNGNTWGDSKLLVMVTPLFLITYGITYFVFSDYPLRDVFQETHFMKGALGLSRFDVLNPFSADSYIPVIQTMNGLLHHYYGYDLLRAQWVAPAMVFVFFFLILNATIRSFGLSETTHWIALAICMIFVGETWLFSNGVLVSLISLLFLPLYAYAEKDPEQKTYHKYLFVFVPAVTLFAVYRFKGFAFSYESILALLAAGALFSGFFIRHGRMLAATYAAVLIAMCLPLLHRGSLLFASIALTLVIARRLFMPRDTQMGPRRGTGKVYVAGLFVGILVAVTAGSVVLNELGYTFYRPDLFALFNLVSENILGTKINSEILLGVGERVALIEMARLITPLAAVLACSGFFACGALLFLGRSTACAPAEHPMTMKNEEFLYGAAWLWIAACALILFVLTGFPYAYRAGFIPAILLGIFLAKCVQFFLVGWKADRQRLFFSMIIVTAVLACTMIAAFAVYGVRLNETDIESRYLRWFHPWQLAFLAALVLLVVSFVMARRKKYGVYLLYAFLVAGLLFDKELLAIRLMGYSYGDDVPRDSATVSHYTRLELDVAEALHELPLTSVLASDPYTLSILRARTGLESIVTYSNLDVLSPRAERKLKSALNTVFSVSRSEAGSGRRQVCQSLLSLAEDGASELNYTYAVLEGGYPLIPLGTTPLPETVSGPALQNGNRMQGWASRFVDPDSETPWMFVAVVSEKSFRWANLPAGERAGYFPMNAPLDPSMVNDLASVFPVLHNFDNRIIVVSIDCRKSGAR